ncbi:MAG: hypothetical protein K2P81_13240 [Bacteriovoracaceae bacterium]|nr:hypothetical protein [Bacteriovoracaceae bacterium]
MSNFLIKTFVLSTLLISFSSIAYAQFTDKKDPLFKVEADLLSEGEVHFSQYTMKGSTLEKELPEIIELDAGKFLNQEGATIELAKTAYVVNKPVGFFSTEQMSDPKWLSQITGSELKKTENGDFVNQKKEEVKVFFDSDDLSNLKSSKVVHSISQSKKLDPIALSGFSTVLIQMKKSIQIFNHIPLSPSKTLIISYQLSVVEKSISGQGSRKKFLKDTEARLKATYP